MLYNINQRIFSVAFFFVVGCGCVLQLVILPMTPWHAGNGLISGSDWIEFHRLAVDLALKINHQGWSMWVPRIEGQAPASVAAALYVITGIEHPWVLLPVHGLLYGIVVVIIYNIASLTEQSHLARLSTLIPLFIFPSTAMIWGQIHKDIYTLTGVLIIFRFWIVAWSSSRCGRASNLVWAASELIFVCIGMLLIIYVRPYLSLIVTAASGLVALLLVNILIIRKFVIQHRPALLMPVPAISLAALGLVAQVLLSLSIASVAPQDVTQPTQSKFIQQDSPGQFLSIPGCKSWAVTRYLPTKMDLLLASVACQRNLFRYGFPDAGSNKDIDVEFTKAIDILKYIPRAIQIGLFAPFPNQWFLKSNQPGGNIMRLLIIPEMIVSYFMSLGILLALLSYKLRIPALIGIVFSITMASIHPLVITNIGTLYRMRYPAMLIWITVGLLGWFAVAGYLTTYVRRWIAIRRRR